MLFSASDNAQTECADLVTKYKECMGTYGFKI
jgi:cytochrome c oxidase assembly protein subunit 17